jgi:hypothetical protein
MFTNIFEVTKVSLEVCELCVEVLKFTLEVWK